MPSPRRISAGALLVVPFAAAACATFGQPRVTLREHMVAHFNQAEAVKAAVIRGNLDATREPARWMAEHEQHPDLPQGERSPMEDLRAFSRQVVRAAGVSDAARSTGESAAACGRCHAAAGAGPRFTTGSMPPTGPTAPSHMRRHDWAAERMWEGLVQPSDRLWEMGATALTGDPLITEGMGDQGAEATLIAREVHDLGSTARTVQADHRASVYGRLLVSCARCHTLIGIPIVERED